MPKIITNSSQLQNAFKRHYKIFKREETSPSYQLLLFYAVECGLKAKFLRDKKLNSTSDFQKVFSNDYGHGHKIARWVAELKISASVANFVDDDSDPIEKVHEKLRYGSNLTPSKASLQIGYLKSIAVFLSKNL